MLAELFPKTLLDRRINHMSLSGSLVKPKYPLSRYKGYKWLSPPKQKLLCTILLFNSNILLLLFKMVNQMTHNDVCWVH